jgi:hypothetical protein
MEIVVCHCLKCKAELGRFRNSWNGIGNTYFSPVHSPLSVNGFDITGDVYGAAEGSQIEDRYGRSSKYNILAKPANLIYYSLLQDLACAGCQHVLGLRCESAPDGHILQQWVFSLHVLSFSITSPTG